MSFLIFPLPQTIDCFTRPGCVQLVGDTEEEVERDFEAIHDNEELGMIDYSVICPAPPAIGAVVVVDPFSSGEYFVKHCCCSVVVVEYRLPGNGTIRCGIYWAQRYFCCVFSDLMIRCSLLQVPTSLRWCCCGATS